ncbi:MAG: TraM recognition domain-containing protein [Solirubrobacterales bacterium]|nr:TraM recognition domain-containing protein [Solirubrobacterales bacterium]
MSPQQGWGPSHQGRPPNRTRPAKVLLWIIVAFAVFGILNGGTRGQSAYQIVCGIALLLIIAGVALPRSVHRRALAWLRRRRLQQDLSQARHRWGAQADGFLTLFGTKLLLTGIADPRTLEAVSVMLGEYDRQVVSRTRPRPGILGTLANSHRGQRSITISTQRTRMLSAGEIANVPAGRGLHLDGVQWELLTLTPAHATEPWRTLTTSPAGR